MSLFVAAIAIVAIVAIRLLLKKKSNELSLRVVGIIPFQSAHESNEETLRQENECFFKDIESDLEQTFKKLFKFDSIKFLWQPNQSFLQRPLLILHNCVKGDGTSQAMRKFSRLPI